MEHLRIWQTWLDYYLLVSLSEALSKLPRDTDLKKMSKKDFDEWLSKRVYEKDNPKYKIIPPPPKSLFSIENFEAMKLYRLTLSLENNATVSGMGGILYEFAKNFGMPSCEIREILSFDKSTKTFALKHAREHFEFLRLMHDHESEMTDYEKILKEADKRLDSGCITDNVNQNDGASHEFSSDDETDLLLALDLDSGLNLNPDNDDNDINDPELLQDYDVLQNDGPREDGIPCNFMTNS